MAYVADHYSGLQIIDISNWKLTGTPGEINAGRIDIKVTAFDGRGGSISDVFAINIANAAESFVSSASPSKQSSLPAQQVSSSERAGSSTISGKTASSAISEKTVSSAISEKTESSAISGKTASSVSIRKKLQAPQ